MATPPKKREVEEMDVQSDEDDDDLDDYSSSEEEDGDDIADEVYTATTITFALNNCFCYRL